MTAENDALDSLLGGEAARSLREWAHLNDLSVAAHLPGWAPPGRGYTGAVLMAVEVSPPARTVVVKLLPAGVYRDEPHAHSRAVRLSPSEFAATHLVSQPFAPYPVSDGRVLMFQDAAGDGLRDAAPLGSLDGTEFTDTCAEVVRGLLTRWNPADRANPPRRVRTSAFLRAELGSTWSGEGSVQAWGRQSWRGGEHLWVQLDGRTLPNPYLMVEGGLGLPDPEVSVVQGLAHRDLHLENVVVPRRRGRVRSDLYRLIDLSSFDPDAALSGDIAMMMLSALAPAVRESMPVSQQRALLGYIVDPRAEHADGIPRQVAGRVDCIRDTAAEIMRHWLDPWTDQLLLSVHATSLIFTSFTNLGPVGRDWYMRLAAHAGGQFLRSRGITPPDAAEAASRVEGPAAGALATHGSRREVLVGAGRETTGGSARDTGGHISARWRMVLALEAVPVMADPQSRAAVLRLLPAEIATSVPRSSVTRIELLGVVDTCLQFPRGLARLWDAVCVVDPGTQARNALADILAEMPEFQEPGSGAKG